MYLHIIGTSQFAGTTATLCVFWAYTIKRVYLHDVKVISTIVKLPILGSYLPSTAETCDIGIMFLAETRDILSRSRARFSHKSH